MQNTILKFSGRPPADLTRKTNSRHWKARFVVIAPSHEGQTASEMFWLKNSSASKVLGRISSAEISNFSVFPRLLGRDYVFSVESLVKNSKTYYFCVESHEELMKWEASLGKLKNSGDRPHSLRLPGALRASAQEEPQALLEGWAVNVHGIYTGDEISDSDFTSEPSRDPGSEPDDCVLDPVLPTFPPRDKSHKDTAPTSPPSYIAPRDLFPPELDAWCDLHFRAISTRDTAHEALTPLRSELMSSEPPAVSLGESLPSSLLAQIAPETSDDGDASPKSETKGTRGVVKDKDTISTILAYARRFAGVFCSMVEADVRHDLRKLHIPGFPSEPVSHRELYALHAAFCRRACIFVDSCKGGKDDNGKNKQVHEITPTEIASFHQLQVLDSAMRRAHVQAMSRFLCRCLAEREMDKADLYLQPQGAALMPLGRVLATKVRTMLLAAAARAAAGHQSRLQRLRWRTGRASLSSEDGRYRWSWDSDTSTLELTLAPPSRLVSLAPFRLRGGAVESAAAGRGVAEVCPWMFWLTSGRSDSELQFMSPLPRVRVPMSLISRPLQGPGRAWVCSRAALSEHKYMRWEYSGQAMRLVEPAEAPSHVVPRWRIEGDAPPIIVLFAALANVADAALPLCPAVNPPGEAALTMLFHGCLPVVPSGMAESTPSSELDEVALGEDPVPTPGGRLAALRAESEREAAQLPSDYRELLPYPHLTGLKETDCDLLQRFVSSARHLNERVAGHR
eukprot:gnl/Dysnectes_brevis/3794_a4878_708.p1 GENE.gnl/Dysnectes_brevis/3794_a4878_708~~gnl/Dysnectes_brevis/3794_a4878_708.p1  ORF type:complete len:755 (-),score=191.87 gnl/Dysnectes_brevis/3794_a4878_708:44-2251(-)